MTENGEIKNDDNSWPTNRLYIARAIDRLEKNNDDFRSETATLRAEIGSLKEIVAGLKVQAGVWAMIGGCVPVALGLAIWAIQNFGK
jgi:hypothetical protein